VCQIGGQRVPIPHILPLALLNFASQSTRFKWTVLDFFRGTAFAKMVGNLDGQPLVVTAFGRSDIQKTRSSGSRLTAMERFRWQTQDRAEEAS
jgi:hypothetical protein